MADKSVGTKTAQTEVNEVGFWSGKKGIRADVMAGVMHANGWKQGKAVTEKEFDSAVQNFLQASANGRKRK